MELHFEPEPVETTPRRHPRWLLALAVTPWVVIAAFLVITRLDTNLPVESAAPLDSYGIPPQPLPLAQPPDATPIPTPQPADARPDPFTQRHPAFEAYAALAAHDYFLALREDDPRVEFTQIVVEQVDFTSPSVPVATVLLNFRVEGAAQTARLAIPMALTAGGIITHFAIYPVAMPEQAPTDYMFDFDLNAFTPFADTDAITRTLRDAGYRNVTVNSAVTGADWPVIAFVEIATDWEETVEYAIFLHDTAGGLVVAGQPTQAVVPLSLPKVAP